jgi:hypothetical protein
MASKNVLRAILGLYWIGILASPLPSEFFHHSEITGPGLLILAVCIYVFMNFCLLARAVSPETPARSSKKNSRPASRAEEP